MQKGNRNAGNRKRFARNPGKTVFSGSEKGNKQKANGRCNNKKANDSVSP